MLRRASAGSRAGFVTGIMADLVGRRGARAIALASAAAVAVLLPREQKFVRCGGRQRLPRPVWRTCTTRSCLCDLRGRFRVLFCFMVTFTYVSFHLAAPPLWIFTVMAGRDLHHLSGRHRDHAEIAGVGAFGLRGFIIATIGVWMCGALLTLAPPVHHGRADAVCGMLCQAISTGHVAGSLVGGRASHVRTSFSYRRRHRRAACGLTWASGRLSQPQSPWRSSP